MSKALIRSSCLLTVALVGCGLIPERVAFDDERMQPLLAAVDEVDREELGFTELSPDAEYRLEGKAWKGWNTYDAMLHVYGRTSRTIAFRRAANGFVWIGEQESTQGPGRFDSPDGVLREQITITFDRAGVYGTPRDQVHVSYQGEDPTLAWPNELTLSEVVPILERWRRLPD